MLVAEDGTSVQRRTDSSVIPAKQGKAFELATGNTIRVVAHEGKQVGDLYVCSRDDPRERFSSHVTASANGSMRRAEMLFSGPPFFRPLLRVSDDPSAVHWIHGRCNSFSNGYRFGNEQLPNCHDNIVNALTPYGLTPYEVALDTFNIFMHTEFDEECRYRFERPVIEAGGYIEFVAERDVLVAISACPYETAVNDNLPKSLLVEIAR